MKESKLNVDVAKSIAQLQNAMKDFEFKRKVYKNIFLGKGPEFDGYHVYSHGEDATLIDWKASKRTNRILSKQFVEEKNQKVVFVIDVGEHMVFGSTKKLKCEYAAEVVAALAYLIINSGDQVGYILFNDKVRRYEVPEKGTGHFFRFLDILADSKTYGLGSNINNALDFALSYLDNSISALVIISDFLSVEGIDNLLKLVSKRFESIGIMVKDPLDLSLPKVSGEIVVENPETGEQILINPKVAGKNYEKIAREQENRIYDIFGKNQVDLLKLNTNEEFVPILAEFLKNRLIKRGGA